MGLKRFIAFTLSLGLIFNSSALVFAQNKTIVGLPEPGTMVSVSSSYVPVIVKGLRVHPENPILFDFILDTGNSRLGVDSDRLRSESEKLIKYFLASLTIPDGDLWVNLSPYEKSRIIPQQLGQTVMGRDMLAQDYILKQLTASLIYPERALGKEFWNKVYAKAKNLLGSSDIPVNTFNKVWIVADKAKVYVHNNTAFVVACHLKVMLEEDYLAMYKHEQAGVTNSANAIGSQVVREIVLPELEKEVNGGKNFADLRQIYNSMILAAWYKKSLKEALLNQVYSNKAKINGIALKDKTIKERIYQEYLQAYKKGVFNYIKEDAGTDGQVLPRKYFSGGLVGIGPNDFAMVGRNDPDAKKIINEGAVGEDVEVEFTTPPQTQSVNPVIPAVSDPMPRPQNPSGVLSETDAQYFYPNGEADLNGNIVSWIKPGRAPKGGIENIDEALKLGGHIAIVKKELPHGYVLDFEKKSIYVTQEFADRVEKSENHLFDFYVREMKEIEEYSRQINNQNMTYDERRFDAQHYANEYAMEKFGDSIEKLFSDREHNPFFMRDKLISNLMVREGKTVSEYVEQVKELIKMFGKKIKTVEPKYRYLVRFKGELYMSDDADINNLENDLHDKRAVSLNGGNGNLVVVLPTANAKAVNKEDIEAANHAADIMMTNALNGIADYTLMPPTTIEEMKSYKGKKLSMVLFFSKFNPPTIAHEGITVFLTYALSGADSYVIGVSKTDFRKKFVGLSYLARKALALASFRGFGNGKIGFLEEDNKYDDDNGEEAHYKILEELEKIQKGNPDLKIEIKYPFGDDHNQVFAGNVYKDGTVHGIFWDKWDDVLERMYAIWMGKNWKTYKGLVKEQLADPGHKWFYSVDEETSEEYSRKKTIIDLIVNADSWKSFHSAFIALPKNDQILPRLESFGKEYITKKRFSKMDLIPMRTVRASAIVEDKLRDKMLKDGRMTIISVPGFSGEVSATQARNFLAQMMFHIFNFRLGYVLSTPVLRRILVKEDLFHLLTRQDPISGLPGNIENAYLRNEDINDENIRALRTKWEEKIKEEEPNLTGIRWNESDSVDFVMDLDKGGGKISPASITVMGEGKSVLAEVTFTVSNSLSADTGADINIINVVSKNGPEAITDSIIDYIKEVNNGAKVKDSAMTSREYIKIQESIRNEGGIDFNPKNLQMDISGEEINVRFDPAMLGQFQQGDFSGVVPIILQITPVRNLEEESLVKAA